mmetsp:Transcript_10526/g.11962  ORF Transcript_10526/g.11962 Transcript_10526/m.11962 type:complete len:82 (+) Transcript_10526:990-1235(+)
MQIHQHGWIAAIAAALAFQHDTNVPFVFDFRPGQLDFMRREKSSSRASKINTSTEPPRSVSDPISSSKPQNSVFKEVRLKF